MDARAQRHRSLHGGTGSAQDQVVAAQPRSGRTATFAGSFKHHSAFGNSTEIVATATKEDSRGTFDEVRGRILGRQPLPPLGEVFSEIRREDCRRSVMMKKKEDETVEKSALVAANNPAPHATGNTDLAIANISAQRPYSNQRRLEDKPRVWCDYCNKPRHTQENC
ncbi:hypothetical protein F0562_011703 [Nyssa sinensis]|uniref:Uncharacterized protein n=1 Tax=Nyssa sinensis TaxID=561372 RepID=A0A5J4ZRF0_9ASTE|nr:hypothetical protein F0562_011703 [Nyssa sinensis]